MKRKTEIPLDEQVQKIKERHSMLSHVIEGFLTDSFTPLSTKELLDIAEKNFFWHKPLIPLTPLEESILRSTLIKTLNIGLNRDTFGKLAWDVWQIKESKKTWEDKHNKRTMFLWDIEWLNQHIQYKVAWLLSKEQKIVRLFRTQFWQNIIRVTFNRASGWSSHGSINLQGNRHFNQYWIWNNWGSIVKATQQLTGKFKLKILDIWCGVGVALWDIKNMHPDFETHGLTVEQEPWMSEGVDKFYYHLAERMPENFLNQFDIIISATSFRYHSFPHISLRNSVLALSRWWRMIITFSYEASPLEDKSKPEIQAMHQRYYETMSIRDCVEEEFNKLRKLEQQWKIELIINDKMISRGYQGCVEIIKLEEIDPQELV